MPRLVQGICEARRASAAAADPRLACCLLWLAAPALRRSWSEDLLAALLCFCDAAMCEDEEPSPGSTGRAGEMGGQTSSPHADHSGGDDSTAEGTREAGQSRRQEAVDDSAPREGEMAEARAELAARLDGTAVFLVSHCGGGVARFVSEPSRRREAGLLVAALDRTQPELARRLRLRLPADTGTPQL